VRRRRNIGRLIEFLVYITGVVFFSWNYYRLKGALDLASFLVFAALYLFGVSRVATFVSSRIAVLIGRAGDDREV
jgi:hypothetical protein